MQQLTFVCPYVYPPTGQVSKCESCWVIAYYYRSASNLKRQPTGIAFHWAICVVAARWRQNEQ